MNKLKRYKWAIALGAFLVFALILLTNQKKIYSLLIPSQHSSIQTLLLYGFVLGLLDGIIGPCTFSIVLFLIGYLLTLRVSKRKLILCGLTYNLGVFLMYFLFLIGLVFGFSFLFEAVRSVGLEYIAFKILGAILLVVAILEIKDFFFYGKGVSLGLPKFLKPSVEKLIKYATLPSSFLAGVLAGTGAVICAMGFPFAYVPLVVKIVNKVAIRLLLVIWYLFWFIVPLVLLVFIISKNYDLIEEFEKKYEEGKRYMRLAIGAVTLFFAVIFMFFTDLFVV